ncbi:MAG TPA: hypothetical protein VFJ26_03195, partial [Dyella sp.]|nr:hypothetical protein [Dyella sp.]
MSATDASTRSPLPNAPGVLQAFGLILLYFLLQVVAGTLMGVMAGAIEKIRHPQLPLAEVRKHATDVLQQPDSNAMLVVVAVPLIAMLLFWLVHRT